MHQIQPATQMSRYFAVIATVAGLGLALEPVAAAQFPWFGRSKPPTFVEFHDLSGRFTLERPKDWEVVAGAGETVVTFLQKKHEAQVVVGHFQMAVALSASEVTDVFANIEASVLKGSQPGATNVVARLDHRDGQPFVIIDYERPGLKGPERARQYSLPRGQDDFRLSCSASPEKFASYEPIFEHIVKSFTPRSGPS